MILLRLTKRVLEPISLSYIALCIGLSLSAVICSCEAGVADGDGAVQPVKASDGAMKGGKSKDDEGWIDLFNGKDIKDWKVKITGFELGENFADTFRVEDGIMKVSYDGYDNFGGRFGHIFYKKKFSHYRLRVEYRFVGEQVAGGPGWALRNSGIMLHCQAPESMKKDQNFPDSIEVQLLGGNGKDQRTNCNVCTPGTNIVMNDKLVTKHCINSISKTYHGDQWVTAEVEVRGNDTVKHILEGETVLEYEKPQLGDGNAEANKKIPEAIKMLSEGYISLQSESHPVEFRKVQIRLLD